MIFPCDIQHVSDDEAYDKLSAKKTDKKFKHTLLI